MALFCRSYLLKTGMNYSQYHRIMLKIVNQHYVRNLCISNNVWPCVLMPRKPLLENQIPVSACWKFRTYAKRMGKGNKQKAILTDDELSQVIDVLAYREEQQAVVDKLKADFITHLSLRTAAGTIDSLMVNIDGEEFPLNELAQISKKNPQLIAINMVGFPEGLKPAIQAITDSGSGMNPQQEGTMIYLAVPKVTREFRDTLAKNAKNLFTKAKNDIRNIQNSFIKKAKNQTELSEDLVFSAVIQLTAIAEDFTAEATKVLRAKQNDLLGNK